MKYYAFEEAAPRIRTAYMRQYYLEHRKSIRKRPVMTEQERKAAQAKARQKYNEQQKLLTKQY